MSDSYNQILIIGAGVGGLALGQILKANDVPFRIFESDDSLHARQQGWAVALSQLDDIYTTSVNAIVGVLDAAVVLDAATGDKLASVGGVAADQPGHILRCRREHLRAYLSQDIPISFCKQFSHYVEDSQGVSVFFTDGTSVRGSVLVGFDGASSKVRRQLLNRSAVQAPFIPLMGRATVSSEDFQRLHELGSAGLIACRPNLRYMIGLLSPEHDGSPAEYYYAVSYQPLDLEVETAWAQTASKEELYDKALRETEGLPDFLTDIIRTSGFEGIIMPMLKFVEFVPPASLPVGRVTLAGDAAHSMMPFQGAGANTALLDACDLASLLINISDMANELEVISTMQAYSCILCP